MSYRLNPQKPVDKEIQRVLQEEMKGAAEELRKAAKGNGEEAIHEARKNVKKIRAVLRLVQRELGGIYGQENARFREIGRTLSELRDAGAMVETLTGLRKQYGNEVNGRAWNALHKELLKRKRATEEAVDARRVFRDYPRELEAAANKVKDWPLQGKGFRLIAPGLEQAFRRGRKAMREVQGEPTAENFHEWRKRVKDHWYHARLLERVWGDMMSAYGGVLKDLQTWLGDDHNLVVLGAVMESSAGEARELFSVIERHQARLREQALITGARVYGAKPKQLVKAIGLLWGAPVEPQEKVEEL